MIGDIHKLVDWEQFVPFTIHHGDGSALRVPPLDHVWISPEGSRVSVGTDDDDDHIVAPPLISHLTWDSGFPISN